MADIEVKEVIVSRIQLRGDGTKHSPYRRVTQVFEKDGTFIAENDPSPESFGTMDLVHFANWLNSKPETYKNITHKHVNNWLNSLT